MLWQMLLVEWPLKLLRSLWAARGRPLSHLLEKISWRRLVFIAVMLVAVAAFAQMFSLDVAFFMAGDVAFYFELTTAVTFLVVRGHVRQSAHAARLAWTRIVRRAQVWFRQCAKPPRQRHNKGASPKHKAADDSDSWLPVLNGVVFPS